MLKSRFFTTILVFFSFTKIFSQDILTMGEVDCPMEGSTKRDGDKTLNQLKNRYIFPKKSDFDPNFNWTELAKFEDDRDKFSSKKAAILRGYILRVRMSAAETCNCNSKEPAFRDTHIIITPNKNERGVLNQIVVEVTPRMRILMESRGVDWSQEGLKKWVGKEVEIQGWLFYDYKHGDQSAKVRQKTKGVTRSTAWEIHPVTEIKRL